MKAHGTDGTVPVRGLLANNALDSVGGRLADGVLSVDAVAVAGLGVAAIGVLNAVSFTGTLLQALAAGAIIDRFGVLRALAGSVAVNILAALLLLVLTWPHTVAFAPILALTVGFAMAASLADLAQLKAATLISRDGEDDAAGCSHPTLAGLTAKLTAIDQTAAIVMPAAAAKAIEYLGYPGPGGPGQPAAAAGGTAGRLREHRVGHRLRGGARARAAVPGHIRGHVGSHQIGRGGGVHRRRGRSGGGH